MVMVRSLQAHLLFYVLLPLLVVLAGVVYLSHSAIERQAEARKQEDMELVARSLQPAVSRALELERYGALERALRPAFDFDRVYAAKVYGPDGEVIASVGVPVDDAEKRQHLQRIAEDGSEVGEYSELAGRSVYSYFTPLSDTGGRILGLLQVTRRKSDFMKEIQILRWRGLLLLLGAGVVLGGVLHLGHRRAIGSHVAALAADMVQVERGDRGHRAALRGPREMVSLGRALNAMLDGLERVRHENIARRRVQVELEERVRRAETMAAIGRLASGVAHELGAPLSVIEGHACRVLRRDDLADPGRRSLEEIRREVRRLEQVVRQLLDFARSGKEPQARRIPVERPVRGAMKSIQHEADMVEVRLTTSAASDDLEVLADPVRLEQALVNLLRNAIQATPGGRVEVGWEQEGGEVRIHVADDGPGVPEDLMPRVFEPFFTTKPVGEGVGLGLAVVHGIARECAGRVDIERGPLGGCSFVVALPAVDIPDEKGEA